MIKTVQVLNERFQKRAQDVAASNESSSEPTVDFMNDERDSSHQELDSDIEISDVGVIDINAYLYNIENILAIYNGPQEDTAVPASSIIKAKPTPFVEESEIGAKDQVSATDDAQVGDSRNVTGDATGGSTVDVDDVLIDDTNSHSTGDAEADTITESHKNAEVTFSKVSFEVLNFLPFVFYSKKYWP